MSRTRRTFAFTFCLSVALAVALDASAQTRTETLRWKDDGNTDVPVSGYRVHWGPASRSYDQSRDAGMPESVSGVFQYEIEVDATADVWVAVTAYNTVGESDFSNEKCRGPAGECGSTPPPLPTEPLGRPGRPTLIVD